MKIVLRIIFGVFTGAILGLVFPYGVALLNLLPFLKGNTPYETVLTYMLLSGIFGAVIGGVVAYRIAVKTTASK